MKAPIISLLAGLYSIISYAQPIAVNENAKRIEPLAIGDKIPDLVIKNVLNHSAEEFKLSDFKGKYLILDFWNTRCFSCIQAFPEMDSLQKMFKDDLQIVTITSETRQSILEFFKKFKKIKFPSFPFITEDSVLANYFPHDLVPLHIWVDPSLKVRYISASSNATRQHIKNFIEGKEIKLREKKEISDFDFDKPLIAEGNGRWLSTIKYYSYIARVNPDLWLPELHFVASDDGSIKNLLSGPVYNLLVTAFNEDGKHNFLAKNAVHFDVSDSSKYMLPRDRSKQDSWLSENTYVYDLSVPKEKRKTIFKIMQQDLTRFFDLEVKIEKKKIDCLALIRISAKDKLKSTAEKAAFVYNGMKADSLWGLKNQPLSIFVKTLNRVLNYKIDQPIIDETGYSGNAAIGISIESISPINLTLLKKELRKYDLDLVPKKIATEVLVVTEKN
ncbi:MAG: redoxin domain-containing protein [Chitinophagaceae bacterium]